MTDLVWDEATYLAAYDLQAPFDLPAQGLVKGQRYGYSLPFYLFNPHVWVERFQQLSAKVQMSMGSSIMVVGCGFGYSIQFAREQLQAGRIWGTDISPYIQANKSDPAFCDQTIASSIFNVDITAPDAADQFKALGTTGNGRFNWVFTEFVVESIDPLGLQVFLDACDALRVGPGGVVHLFAGLLDDASAHDQSLGMRWRTLSEWVAERPGHFWLDVHGYQIGGGV